MPQQREFIAHPPRARQRPLVAAQGRRAGVGVVRGAAQAAIGRAETVRPREADVALFRFGRHRAGGGLRAFALRRHEVGGHGGAGAGFFQQLLDQPLGLRVAAFAELLVADAALRVDEVQRRPRAIAEGAPDGVAAVQGDGVGPVNATEVTAWVPKTGAI
jgi:hypothetical protein